jgi:hypothetical protein
MNTVGESSFPIPIPERGIYPRGVSIPALQSEPKSNLWHQKFKE